MWYENIKLATWKGICATTTGQQDIQVMPCRLWYCVEKSDLIKNLSENSLWRTLWLAKNRDPKPNFRIGSNSTIRVDQRP